MGFFNLFRSNKFQVIGKDIKWADVIGKVFKIAHFDKASSIIDATGEVKMKNKLGPYGYLHVGAPDYKKLVLLPIIHRDDFLLASSVFDDAKLSKQIKEFDLLVTYVPKEALPNGFAGVFHALHYVITPHETIDYYYKIEALRRIKSNPEKLFIKFIWEGETRVETNMEPDL
jgi:uncharacterized protein YozE (UPF0346 family)